MTECDWSFLDERQALSRGGGALGTGLLAQTEVVKYYSFPGRAPQEAIAHSIQMYRVLVWKAHRP